MPIYMKIEGKVPRVGPVKASGHLGWWPVESAGPAKHPAVSSVVGRKGEASYNAEYDISHIIDNLSPALMLAASNGEVFSKITLDFVNHSDGNTYMTIVFTKAMITAYAAHGGDGEAKPKDIFTISAENLSFSVVPSEGDVSKQAERQIRYYNEN